MKTFKELGLNTDIMKSLDDLGFVEPSAIQAKAIPFILESKKDLIALAQTGTGKTAAFSLPILNQLKGKALESIIICPTRELCLQISQDIKTYAKYSKDISVTPVYGGERIDIQIKALRRGTNIVVGTPGRVCDLIRRNILNLNTIKYLVLDEADEMLDMGFKEDLDTILDQIPNTKRTLLFSATISKSVHSIAKKYMGEAEEISIGEKNVGADNVSHEYYVVQARDRFEALQRILDSIPGIYGILFCRTRNQTQEVADKLKKTGYDTEALHGEITQSTRTKIMDRFKKQQVKLLVATDVAARGIDVNNLSHVINYNLPDQNESYTHRSGRTGRAQKKGIAISILSTGDARRVRELENIIGKKFEYKKVPDGDDVCRTQINNIIKEIEESNAKESENEEYFKEFADRLKKINKDDLIKHFITNRFNHLIDSYKNTRDLNARTVEAGNRKRDEDNVNLEMNFGKQDGLDVKGLFALINFNKKLKGVEIGKIDLMLDHCIFAVDKTRADEVIKFLKGTKIKGRAIEIKRSARKAEYTRPRRSRAPRGNSGGGRSRGPVRESSGKKRDFRRNNNRNNKRSNKR